jgi:hypothetical protein
MFVYSLYALVPFAVLAAGYVLHRTCLYLEERGYIDYLHKTTTPGSAFSPLQELIQPQIRHVTDVSQRKKAERDERSGDPDSPTASASPKSSPDDAR